MNDRFLLAVLLVVTLAVLPWILVVYALLKISH